MLETFYSQEESRFSKEVAIGLMSGNKPEPSMGYSTPLMRAVWSEIVREHQQARAERKRSVDTRPEELNRLYEQRDSIDPEMEVVMARLYQKEDMRECFVKL